TNLERHWRSIESSKPGEQAHAERASTSRGAAASSAAQHIGVAGDDRSRGAAKCRVSAARFWSMLGPVHACGLLTKPKWRQSRKRTKWTMARSPLILGVSTKPVPNRGTETSAR